MSLDNSASMIPETMQKLYRSVQKQINDDIETGAVKCAIIGAAGTIVIGTAIYMSSRKPSRPSRSRQARSRQARLLLGRPGASNTGSRNKVLDETAQEPDDAFSQLRSAYSDNRELVKHTGGCHCGRVRFLVEAPRDLDCIDSDRNMYTLKGRFPHIVVPKSRVVLLTNHDNMGVYHFGNLPLGRVREVYEFQNLFCKTCGVHCFGFNKAKNTMHVNTMCLDMDCVRRVGVSFDSDRSKFHVMKPFIYEPSIAEAAAVSATARDLHSSTSTSHKAQPWNSEDYANYDDLPETTGTAGKTLTYEDDDDIERPSSFSDLTGTDVDSPNVELSPLVAVERLRLHLQKHVQEPAPAASTETKQTQA